MYKKNEKRVYDILKKLDKFKQYIIIVEGKKDKAALQKLDFQNIFVINEIGKSVYEKIEEIESLLQKEGRKKKVCILTDFDKQGKKLYLLLKRELSTRCIKLDNSLRDFLLRTGLSHIEGIGRFLSN